MKSINKFIDRTLLKVVYRIYKGKKIGITWNVLGNKIITINKREEYKATSEIKLKDSSSVKEKSMENRGDDVEEINKVYENVAPHKTYAVLTSSEAPKERNLTEEGNIDWLQFNSNSIKDCERKNVDRGYIEDICILIDKKTALAMDTITRYIYEDGKKQKKSLNFNNTGTVIFGKENGLQFKIPYIDSEEKSLSIYVGAWESKIVIEGYINDELIPAIWDYIDYYEEGTKNYGGDTKHRVFYIKYKLLDKNDRLTIRIYIDELYDKEYGSLTVQAVTIR